MRDGSARWPATADALIAEQLRLADETPDPWRPPAAGIAALADLAIGGCFACFPRGAEAVDAPGAAGDPAWAAAAIVTRGERARTVVVEGVAGAPYIPGQLALREGVLLDAAVRALPRTPAVLLVNATGRDHPRRAGLALQLGAVLDIPTVGVTHRPLLAGGPWPADERGAHAPLVIRGEIVGAWLRTRAARRPLAVHAAWRTDVETAVAVVRAATRAARTPEPLRRAREAAREARALATR